MAAARLAALVCGATLLLVAASSCALGGFDFDKAPPSGSGQAAGGHGAAGGGAGAGGEAGGAGGSGAGQACSTPADCTGTDSECAYRSCEEGKCLTVLVPKGTPTSAQIAQNCQRRVCDGRGGISSEEDPADTFDDGKECTEDVCEDGVPKNNPKPPPTACGKDGLLECDGLGNCKGCDEAMDCGTVPCIAWTCDMTSKVCIPSPADPDTNCGPCKTCQSGACAFAPTGTSDPATCQVSDCHPGACDGNGGCQLSLPGTACGVASCSNDTLNQADKCDPIGNCLPGNPSSCAPYTCSGTSCKTTCANAPDCADSYQCDAPSCVDCLSCSEFLIMPGKNLTPCTASATIKQALTGCVCGAKCGPTCQSTLCMKLPPSSMCTSCINLNCGPQLLDCQNDDGEH